MQARRLDEQLVKEDWGLGSRHKPSRRATISRWISDVPE